MSHDQIRRFYRVYYIAGLEQCREFYADDPHRSGVLDNPYPAGSHEHAAWRLGWNDYWDRRW